jgi:ABC-2 type transport system ATP-binding protein
MRSSALAAAFAFAVLAPTPVQAAQLPILNSCQAQTDTTDAFSYRLCRGYVASFDGVELDTDLTMPPGTTPSGGYPLLVMMHGWGASKSYWETNDFCTTSSADACNYNNLWFAHRGYAVVTYTARGFHGSQGYTHLGDIRYEARDTQTIAGLLVDAGVAMPGIGVTGLSYGGGQSWLLAVLANQVMNTDGTLARWRSPGGTPLHIAASVPKYGWSDLGDALQPNGRSSDGVLTPNGDRTNPIGIEKKSYVDYFYQLGLQTGRYAAPGQDPSADITTWYTEISAGETPAQASYAPGIINAIAQYRSAYYQDSMIAGDVANKRETPVLDVQGWTDALFPETQAAPMVEKLRSADGGWPVYMYASDLGHPPANNDKFSEWKVINQAATDFLDLHVKHSGGANPVAIYQEQVVTCDNTAGAVYASNTASGVAPARVTYQSSTVGHLTASAPTDAAAGIPTDPIAFYAGNGGKGGCVRLALAPPDAGASTSWAFPVCSSFTMLGEPGLELSATVTGSDVELNSRLWDIAPDGSAVLVTRGAYRWIGSPGAASVAYALQGSGWTFVAGHLLRIEVTQNDAPYLRLDNYPSSVTYTSMKLTLPTVASNAC